MSLRVWGRLSVAPWNLVATNKNSRPQKIHHVRLESCEHLVSLACCGFSPPLSFPLCPDSFDLFAVCDPGSPFKEKIIFGFHKKKFCSSHLSALVVSRVDGSNTADFHLFWKLIFQKSFDAKMVNLSLKKREVTSPPR